MAQRQYPGGAYPHQNPTRGHVRSATMPDIQESSSSSNTTNGWTMQVQRVKVVERFRTLVKATKVTRTTSTVSVSTTSGATHQSQLRSPGTSAARTRLQEVLNNKVEEQPAQEAISIAKRIRNLLDSPITSPIPTTSKIEPPATRYGEIDTVPTSPLPRRRQPRMQIKDPRLAELLSSPTVMNGSSTNYRNSVFSVLDHLEAPRHEPRSPGVHSGRLHEESGTEGVLSDDDYTTADDSSIMMYSPLMPTRLSLVELAESEFVPFAIEPPDAPPTPPTSEPPPSVHSSPLVKGKGIDRQGTSALQRLVDTPLPNEQPEQTRTRPRRQRVWVPSTTKISFQAMWWGYRIYLPPPVLAILNNKQLEATKRAALITGALTWFFSHLPLATLPLPLRPALLLLQTLIPYGGYIGTFIAWSWSTVKSYDTGMGVIMTATWLLPVALIPGTWDENSVPVPLPMSPDLLSKDLPPLPPEIVEPPLVPPKRLERSQSEIVHRERPTPAVEETVPESGNTWRFKAKALSSFLTFGSFG